VSSILGIIASAGADLVTGNVGGAASAVAGGFNIGGGGGNATDNARKARVDSYVVGAEHGIVDSARYLLGGLTTQGAKAEHALYVAAQAKLEADVPNIMAQAQQLGALHDTGDGQNGLRLLAQNHIYFNEPNMGENTASAGGVSAVTKQWVDQVRAATAQAVQEVSSGAANAATNALQPGSPTKVVPVNTKALWWIAGGVVALILIVIGFVVTGRRRK
jgi:hypothetical protein